MGNLNFYIAKPVVYGFEATLLFCAENDESLKAYLDKYLPIQCPCIRISEQDFNLFSNSGFKTYICPTVESVDEVPDIEDTDMAD